MVVLQKDVIEIEKQQDSVYFRNRIKELAAKIGVGLVNQTKLMTAASELTRNMLNYAEKGKVTIMIISDIQKNKNGIQLIFEDKGPGIEDISLAMKEGYSSQKSLGIGLPGARKLVNEFKIESEVGKGTTVSIIMWKDGR